MREKLAPRARSTFPDRAIGAIADRQQGVVATRQLLATGLGRSAISRRVSRGWLHRVYRGVYAVGHARLTQNGWFMAAVLACGEGAVLSHRSAALLWGMWQPAGGHIDVTVPGRGGARGHRGRRRILVHRPRGLADSDRTVRRGIPVTSPARTVLDLANVVSMSQLGHLFEEAERLGLVGRDELTARCESGRSGGPALRALLASVTLPLSETRSELERRFLRFCRDRGLPIPAVNVPLGPYVVDCLWSQQRVVGELDSWRFHGDRDAFEGDRVRDTAIQRMGHRIVRITDRRVRHGAVELEADLRDLLGIGEDHITPRMRPRRADFGR